ncbi:hypothetical protein G3576_14610 [Roseomonas stagni]|uniref:Uncharacterized protein n=1 Tax=Falsiroseomonas algicola TaxID=2716930 RepID=A0A6M1LM14_9PROT|nr:hypothetical protein [Falsiroseomonas algicola]NGM21253.1 hypothetical protein [Falsiroseomonas algicola]
MTGGASFATRLGGVLAIMLLLGCALTAGLNYLKFERMLLEQQAKVLEILAGELGGTVENSLALGVRLAGVPGAQALLERARAAEPLIGGLAIADSDGVVLFDTDRQNLGTTVARALFDPRAAADAWRFRDGDRYGIGAPIVNGFGQLEGAVLLRYGREAVDERLTSALLGMVQAGLLALALAVPLGILGIHLVTRQARRWFAAVETAMQPGAAPEPLASGLQQAIAEADSVLSDAERRLEAIAATIPEPNAPTRLEPATP